MVMLEHDDTLHTRHGIERVMYRGRYRAEAVKVLLFPKGGKEARQARGGACAERATCEALLC